MTVIVQGDRICLIGICGVDEAEKLLTLILKHPTLEVDLATAETVHTALWQVLLALTPRVTGKARDKFVCEWIMPFLTAQS